jgi:type II secretory pathway pseudopilin PulG
MKNRFLLIPALTVAAAIAVVAFPRFQNSQSRLSSKDALALVRSLNSRQATFKLSHSTYGSLQDVVMLGHLDKSFSITSGDSSSATVNDYRVSIVVSSDGLHYQLSMHPDSGCGASFFTNESGVIYQGSALGCPMP